MDFEERPDPSHAAGKSAQEYSRAPLMDMRMPANFDPRRYLTDWDTDPMPVREKLWDYYCEGYVEAGMPYGMSTHSVVVWLEEHKQ